MRLLWCRAYWLSFIPMRLIMYPVLLVRFWRVLEGYPWWDRGLVVGCQLLLCLFNYGKPPAEKIAHLCLLREACLVARILAAGCLYALVRAARRLLRLLTLVTMLGVACWLSKIECGCV